VTTLDAYGSAGETGANVGAGLTREALLRRAAALGLSLPAVGVLADAAVAAAQATVKAAWVYIGPPGDGGWTYQHEQGRLAAVRALGSSLKATKVESVPETPAVATRVIRQLAQQGNNIIFTTSFGYMDPTLNVAKQFPNVKFEHCSGFKSAPNMGNYFGAMEEARYLSGIAAGGKTKANKIGYVAAFPIPEVVRGLNAFTLGVRSVNPDATVRVVWTSTWYDPSKERSAAESLLAVGCDVLAQHQDTPATGQAAQAKGVWWVGYDSDMRRFAPKAFLTAPVWDWGPYYIRRIRAVLNGTWKTDVYYGTMQDGMIKLAPVANVDAKTKQLVAAKQAAVKAGRFNVLAGPIRDQKGKVRIANGKAMSLKDALAWQWLVEGVEGTIPKS
jgi:basic membrane protein A and related proteins